MYLQPVLNLESRLDWNTCQTALYCYDSSYDDNDIVGAEQQLQLRVLQQRWGCLSSLLAFFPRHVRSVRGAYIRPNQDAR